MQQPVVVERARRGHDIRELCVFGQLLRLSVDIDGVVHNFETLAGQTHGAFDKILPAVDGAVFYLAECGGIGGDALAAIFLDKQIVVFGRFLQLGEDSVAGGEVEHDDVAALDVAQSFEAVICERGGVKIAVRSDDRHLVVDQGEVDGSHRHTWAVDHLVDPQVVAGEQSLFKRRRGYLVVLADKCKDEVNEDERVDDCVHPAHDAAHGLVLALFPPCEGDVAGDVNVEQQKPQQREPPVAHPGHPGEKNQ